MIASAFRQALALINAVLMLILLAAGCFLLGLGGDVYWRNSQNPFYGISAANYYIPQLDGEPGAFDPPLVVVEAGGHLNTGRVLCARQETVAESFKALNGFGGAQWQVPQQSPSRLIRKGCHPYSSPTILPVYPDHTPAPGFFWYEFDLTVTMPAPQRPLVEHLALVPIYLNEPGQQQLDLAQATALLKAHPEMMPPKPSSARP